MRKLLVLILPLLIMGCGTQKKLSKQHSTINDTTYIHTIDTSQLHHPLDSTKHISIQDNSTIEEIITEEVRETKKDSTITLIKRTINRKTINNITTTDTTNVSKCLKEDKHIQQDTLNIQHHNTVVEQQQKKNGVEKTLYPILLILIALIIIILLCKKMLHI